MGGSTAGSPDKRTNVGEPRPLGDRANLVMVLLGLTVLVDLIAVAVDYGQVSLLQGLRDGERVTFAEATASDDRVGTVGIIQLVLLVITGIAFLLWYTQAYRNVIALGIRNPRYSVRWAAWCWFVPIVNLFRPKTVMNDIYRGSDPELPYGDRGFTDFRVSPLLHWWWGLWIVGLLITRYATSQAGLNDVATINSVINAGKAYVAADLIDAVAAFMALLIVKRITERAELRRLRMAEESRGQEPPENRFPYPASHPQIG
jgi:hypothetical protein